MKDTGKLRMKTAADIAYVMGEAFNEEELHQFCFDLGIDYENLEGATKQAKVRSFAQHYLRINQLPMLLDLLKVERPDHKWPENGI